MCDNFRLFWDTIKRCDWDHKGDDDEVLKPVINDLSKQSDDVIFQFDEEMSELLYHLDTRELADQCEQEDPMMCDDTFLYSRCAALINGPRYYEKVKSGNAKDVWSMEFESLLYVPQQAWALKHHKEPEDYPHIAALSYETGSNLEKWK